MIKIDNTKIAGSTSAILDYDEWHFDRTVVRSTAGEKKRQYLDLRDPKMGINFLRIDEADSKLIMEISSKMNPENYLKGISTKTFEPYAKKFNATGIIKLDFDIIFEEFEVYTVHVFEDLDFGISISKALADLSFYPHHQSYSRINYPTSSVIHPKSENNGLRLNVYNKYTELMRNNSTNRYLRKFFDSDNAKGKLRIESQFTKFEKIRRFFKMQPKETIKLKNVLESNEKVNYNVFEYLFPALDIDFPFALSDEDLDLSERFKETGVRSLLSAHNYDLKSIYNYLKQNSGEKSRPVRMEKYIEKIYQKTLLEESRSGFKYIKKN